jgi:hypothetical protein
LRLVNTLKSASRQPPAARRKPQTRKRDVPSPIPVHASLGLRDP